ncbi:transcription factor bHLH153-like [Zingiber officinale]|uniref:transcription factor bHLH153-like n=1 Tax=Zingiber officinale TaxID=94328 RepID=UPI001C4D6AE5|nr:transcription factor bHLH153-like [Zingiber officinale]
MMAKMVDHKRRRNCSNNNSFVLRNLAGEERLKTDIPAKKDKVGERVAKLQQLVSPFGKTDTASVLAEAAAYIKFLQEQVQVLSAPYLETTMEGKIESEKVRSLPHADQLDIQACTKQWSRSVGTSEHKEKKQQNTDD